MLRHKRVSARPGTLKFVRMSHPCNKQNRRVDSDESEGHPEAEGIKADAPGLVGLRRFVVAGKAFGVPSLSQLAAEVICDVLVLDVTNSVP